MIARALRCLDIEFLMRWTNVIFSDLSKKQKITNHRKPLLQLIFLLLVSAMK